MAAISLEGMTPDQIADLAVLAKGLTDNPRTRNDFLRLTKQANPDLAIPEVDIPNYVNGVMQRGAERLEALEKKIRENEVQAEIYKRRDTLRAKYQLSESEVGEVEKLMLEKQIASHDTAAEFYKSQQRSAAPTPSTFSVNTMPKIDLKGSGMSNMNQWARSEAGKVIDEMRGRIKG